MEAHMQTLAHNRRIWRDWAGTNDFWSTEPTRERQVISWHKRNHTFALWHFESGATGPRYLQGKFDSFKEAAEAADNARSHAK
jgi:hypothetical protein|tara:strand:- start:258 stop:506 length:249 start_codon:yes stop_codon:yes gene_type:complete